MTKLIVAYPQPANVEDFERAYQEEHVPLALDKLRGMTKLVATKTIASPQGTPAFYRVAEVYFPSIRLWRSAQARKEERKRWQMQ